MTLSTPKNLKAEILAALINENFVTEQQFRINSFRSRISDLRLYHDLNIRHKDVSEVNRYGRLMRYRRHYLWNIDLPKARRIFREINR